MLRTLKARPQDLDTLRALKAHLEKLIDYSSIES